MTAELDPEVRAFLEEMKVPAVLSTLGRQGEPITSAVWYGFHDGDIVVSTPAARPKARNVRSDARLSFIVDTKERPYRGVAIEGEGEVLEDPDHVILRAIGERYLGPVMPDWMRQRTEGQARVAIRIRPTRVRPWGFDR